MRRGETRENWSHYAEGAYTIEKYPCYQTIKGIGLLACLLVESTIPPVDMTGQIEFGANNATYDDAEDEKDGELTLGHVGESSIDTQNYTAQTKAGEERLFVFFAYARAQQGSECSTYQNGSSIDYSSQHIWTNNYLISGTKVDEFVNM